MSEENKQGWVPVSLVNMAIDKFEHTIATLEAQKAALAAENKRLMNAADDIIHILANADSVHLKEDAVNHWKAAKEGAAK